MKRFPLLALFVAAAALFLAACGDDDDPEGADGSDTTAASDETGGSGDDAENGTDLDDGIAAVVDGDEIASSGIEEHIETFSENPQFADQMAGPDGEAARVQLRAQILSTEIVSRILSNGAGELDNPVTEDDLAAARAGLEDQVGGAEQLDAALTQQGLTEGLLQLELTALAAIDNIEEALAEEAGEDPPSDETDTTGEPDPEAELSPAEERAQEFLTGELAAADVTVDQEYGTWSAETGQVVAPGGAPAPAPGGGEAPAPAPGG